MAPEDIKPGTAYLNPQGWRLEVLSMSVENGTVMVDYLVFGGKFKGVRGKCPIQEFTDRVVRKDRVPVPVQHRSLPDEAA